MNKMIKICATLLATLGLSSAVQAAIPGGYLGAGLGGSTLKIPNQPGKQSGLPFQNPLTATKTSTGGLGGRLFGGYNFSQYLGLETGFSTYAGSSFKGSNALENGSEKFQLSAIDLLGKAYLPVGNQKFNLYALGGIAYVNSKITERYSSAVSSTSLHQTTHALRPEFGVGASYDITPQVTSNLEFSRIVGRGNLKTSTSAIPDADRMTLGFAWNIG